MQQTETYKLNLIEPSDPFLPDALNANTQQLEQVVSQHLEDMDQRVAVLEGLKVAFGAYHGDNTICHFIPLPFTPKLVMIKSCLISDPKYSAMACAAEYGFELSKAIKIVENGFEIHYTSDVNSNIHNQVYGYFAFG